MIERDGFMWPEADTVCRPYTMAGLADLAKAVALVEDRGTVLQAGGGVGVWAAKLAEDFGTVVTAEPEPVNFACLRENVPASVIAHNAALGPKRGRCGLEVYPHNAGGHRVLPDGDVKMITIDGLKLAALDLLVLDVEGYEVPAMLGAVRTIGDYRPVIMLEERGHGGRYGFQRGAAEAWLVSEFGYVVAERLEHDLIMVQP